MTYTSARHAYYHASTAHRLAIGTSELNGTFVHLDAREDPTFLEDFNKWFSCS